jgi:2Fe-2S ferredoxin
MPTIVFLGEGEARTGLEVEVEPDTSILEAAQESGARVGSSCGGVCACSTCHVYIDQGADDLTEMADDESDRLDMGFDVRAESRLGCQARVHAGRVVVRITEESLKAFYDEHPDERKQAGL